MNFNGPERSHMSVDKATVARIAHLARIGVNEDELEPLAAELSGILNWIEQLNEVDTDAVPPMASVHDEALRWRADVINDGGKQADIVANAPDGRDGFFAVPKVIE
jgi:aspartyl-tRNA(Asn)/glutamyl-tRNA(Gln) amidotransferase subunit C